MMHRSSRQPLLAKLAASLSMLLLILLSAPLAALPADRLQKIVIEDADKFIQTPLENGEEKTELSGNVLVTQGSRQIRGHSITIIRAQSRVTRVEAKGDLASFSQQASRDKEPVSAKAKEIIYTPANDTLQLSGAATISQQGSTVNGDTILYNAATEQISASGADDRSSTVKIVFDPSASEDTNTATENKP
jgi:lipopolysaccharide export system protein LptA